MCEECQGLGITQEFILDKIIDPEKSVSQDFCSVAGSYETNYYRNVYDNLAHIYSFSVDTPWKKLSPQAQKVLLYGTEKKWTRMVFINPNTGSSWYDMSAGKAFSMKQSANTKQQRASGISKRWRSSCHGNLSLMQWEPA